MAIGGVHGKKKRMLDSSKKKKKKDPSKVPGKHRKTSKRDRTDDGKKTSPTRPSAPKPKIASLGNTKSSGPPWQVMGEKDMKKNVEAEKLRRERINLGLESPSAGIAMAKEQKIKADVSGSNRLISEKDRVMLKWKRFNSQTAPSELRMVGGYLNKQLPPSLGVPEIAFLGRSNVGKSSLLNRLVTKAAGDSARVGKTPGATASVNLYALLGPSKGGNSLKSKGPSTAEGKPILGFADLPGFGYAKLSKETKESVEEAAERYLGKRRELALGILLVDSRRIPSEDDRVVLAALFDMGVPIIVVATKSDKLKANEIEPAMRNIREGLGLPDGQPLRVSGVTGEGVKELWQIILDACETRVSELKKAIEEGKDDGGALRILSDDTEEDDFYDDYEEDEDEYFDDDEDIAYDQGYDWIQQEGSGDAEEDEDFTDSFYDDEDAFIDDDNDELDESNWNEQRQRDEKEFMKLKNLKKVVKDMERRGQI
jgi:GTP-binding protein